MKLSVGTLEWRNALQWQISKEDVWDEPMNTCVVFADVNREEKGISYKKGNENFDYLEQ